MDFLKVQFDKAVEKIGILFTNSLNIQCRGIYQQIKDTTDSDGFFLLVSKDSVKQGELLTIDNRQYLVTVCNKDYNQIYDRLSLKNAHLPLNFLVSGVVNSTYCRCIVGGVGVVGTEISVLDGKIKFEVPSTTSTRAIKLEDRVIKFNSVWKVLAVTQESENILSIFAQIDIIYPEDDLILEIPKGAIPPVPKVTSILITPDVNYVKKTNTAGTTFNVTKLVDGVATTSTFTFTLDATTTATPDNYTFTIIDGNNFNVKSFTTNKKVVVKCQEDGGELSVLKTINLMLY